METVHFNIKVITFNYIYNKFSYLSLRAGVLPRSDLNRSSFKGHRAIFYGQIKGRKLGYFNCLMFVPV